MHILKPYLYVFSLLFSTLTLAMKEEDTPFERLGVIDTKHLYFYEPEGMEDSIKRALIVPGFNVSEKAMLPLIQELINRKIAVYFCVLPGHRSDESTMDYESWVDFIERAIKEAAKECKNEKKELIVIGHSLGGALASKVVTEKLTQEEAANITLALIAPVNGLKDINDILKKEIKLKTHDDTTTATTVEIDIKNILNQTLSYIRKEPNATSIDILRFIKKEFQIDIGALFGMNIEDTTFGTILWGLELTGLTIAKCLNQICLTENCNLSIIETYEKALKKDGNTPIYSSLHSAINMVSPLVNTLNIGTLICGNNAHSEHLTLISLIDVIKLSIETSSEYFIKLFEGFKKHNNKTITIVNKKDGLIDHAILEKIGLNPVVLDLTENPILAHTFQDKEHIKQVINLVFDHIKKTEHK